MFNFLKTSLAALTLFGLAGIANAAPTLKDNIIVISPIVTVGDMFEDAGLLAEEALFRSPAPGTMGQVSVQSIRVAVAKIGFENFENPGFASVNVSRAGITVDLTTFENLITADLRAKNVLREGMSVTAFLNTDMGILYAQDSAVPVTLTNLRYIPGTNQFSARFNLVGQARPVDISGRLDFSILTPHMVRALPAGSILQPGDIEMRQLPLQFANTTGATSLDQFIGRQLLRNQLDGSALRLADVAEPILITRNQIVTLFLKSGAMTLTVKGQALADAAKGQTVSVLNLMSNTVVQGVASDAGTVEISATSTRIASL